MIPTDTLAPLSVVLAQAFVLAGAFLLLLWREESEF